MQRPQLTTVVESLHCISLYPSHTTCNDLEVIVDSKPLLLVYIKYVIKVSPPHMKKQTNGVAFPREEMHFFFPASVTESSTESKN